MADTVDPLLAAEDPVVIKDAQNDVGKLDLHVCGECHDVFHYVQEFKEHKVFKKCSKKSELKATEIEDTSQAWGFCLWKGKELKNSSSKPINAWFLYQKWGRLSQKEKDTWIVGGRTLQSLDKIRAAKMQEVKFKVRREDNADPLSLSDKELPLNESLSPSKEPIKPQPGKLDKSSSEKLAKEKHAFRTIKDNEREEFVVEAIVGKRFNARKKQWEYKVKWEDFDLDESTWEPAANMSSCKSLLDEFEEKLKKDKENKPKMIVVSPKIKKKDPPIIESPSEADLSGKRPQRSSKQRAMNQVKEWIGSISDDEQGTKRYHEDDSDDSFDEKKIKMEEGSEESESESKPSLKKTPRSVRSSNGLGGAKYPENVLIPDAQGIVRINQKQIPSLSSGVYIMSKTAGIIKLDSQTSKIAASGGQAIVKVAPKIGQTHIRIVKKDGAVASNKIIQMSPIKGNLSNVKLSMKTPPKLRKVDPPKEVKKRLELRRSMMSKAAAKEEEKTESETTNKTDPATPAKPEDEESSDGVEDMEFPTDELLPEPDSPQGDYVLDPLTGKIAGQEYPEIDPEPQICPEPVFKAVNIFEQQDDKENELDKDENPESSVDNIVKLAAADITEDDLKTDPITDGSSTFTSGESLSKTADSSDGEPKQPEPRKLIKKIVRLPRLKHKQSILNTALTNSNILEKPTHPMRPMDKPFPRTMSQGISPKFNSPRFNNKAVYGGMRAKSLMSRPPRFTMSSPGPKLNETLIKTYSKSPVVRRAGGSMGGGPVPGYKRPIGSTPKIPPAKFVHRTSTSKQPVHSIVSTYKSSPKFERSPQINKSGQETFTLSSIENKMRNPAAKRAVISMPSLTGDDDTNSQDYEQSEAAETEAIGEQNSEQPVLEPDLGSFTLNDDQPPLFISGDDGTVYQVAGHNEQGQTILITQGPDGQQQCLIVSNEAVGQEEATAQEQQEEEAQEELPAEEPAAVAPEQQEPLAIATEPESTDQVVAQVVRAEPPSPGGTHKVVVMLPDGNLMVTQVTPEEYESLELDK